MYVVIRGNINYTINKSENYLTSLVNNLLISNLWVSNIEGIEGLSY